VEGLRAGAAEAYETLINRYQQPVYSLIYRLMNDPIDTSDVVQEVFLKVFRNIGAFRGQSSLKTWIYRIAVNEAHNHRRWFSRHRRQEVGLEAQEEGALCYRDSLSDRGRSPFELASGQETMSLIEEALSGLKPVFRTAVVLRDVEDLSYEEIAHILQVSLGTVKSRILRGRETLRRTLAGQFECPEAEWSDAGQVEFGSAKP
jgi:RNA polymerase sigma-70 factor (ECF subfamily)